VAFSKGSLKAEKIKENVLENEQTQREIERGKC
jgi:hypothetical protein